MRDAITLQVARTKLNAVVLDDLSTEDLIKVFGAYGALAFTDYKQDDRMSELCDLIIDRIA